MKGTSTKNTSEPKHGVYAAFQERSESADSYFTSRLAKGVFNPADSGSSETGTLIFAGAGRAGF
jgi:hypothetical protein